MVEEKVKQADIKVTYEDHMGTDLTVVNAAKVSFNKKSTVIGPAEERLIGFLARGCTTGDWDSIIRDIMKFAHTPTDDYTADFPLEAIGHILKEVKIMPTHWSPFAHTAIQIHVKAPIAIAGQMKKHQVGLVWNEVSRRYVTDEPEFYMPDGWRKAVKDKKQGSSRKEFVETISLIPGYPGHVDFRVKEHWRNSLLLYNAMIEADIAPELARMVLPQNMMTEWVWTGNVYSFANLCHQRLRLDAQEEANIIARQIDAIIRPLFPVSWRALID